MDSDLQFSYISDRYLSIAGINPDSMLGTTREELLSKHIVEPNQWRGHIDALKTHNPIDPITVEWRRPDGTIRHIFIDGKRMFSAGGVFSGYRGIARDVTDITIARQETELALEKAESASLAKSNFLANISHEIRTPMTLIIGMSEMLNETRLSKQQQSYLATMSNAGDSLLALINRILDMSKIETGNLVLASDLFNLHDVVSNLVDAYTPRAQEKGLQLELEIMESVQREQVGDSYRLEQVLRNLLDNAIKFTRKGKVSVTVENNPHSDSPQSLMFSVADTGVGIAPGQHDTIFDAFVQQDASTTREFGGTGLGLAISRQIVMAMDGEIRAESNAKLGSKFIFTINFAEPSSVRATPDHLAAVDSAKPGAINILLVEDEILIRTLINEYLQDTPHRVTNAMNGREGLEMMQSGNPDLVLMDLRMPEMDGYTAAREMREWEQQEQRRTVPIIALSASVMAEDVEECLLAGFTSHLGKPILKSRLLEVIGSYARTG
jgi:signal transduction histidine kinase/CheY-like chemotaxis protein